MPHSRKTSTPRASRRQKPGNPTEARYTVGLVPAIASRVERYAQAADTSMSKALSTLVRLGLEGQDQRKREFLKKLKANLNNDDSASAEQVIDEFRDLILGR